MDIIIVICNNTKDNFLLEPEEIDVKLHRNCTNTSKISYVRFHFVKFETFEIYFLGLQYEIFFGVITNNLKHVKKKMQYALN